MKIVLWTVMFMVKSDPTMGPLVTCDPQFFIDYVKFYIRSMV